MSGKHPGTADRLLGWPTISDDEAALIVKALEHYDAYLKATRREDGQYKTLAERLKRKPPGPEIGQKEKRKKA